MNRSGDKTWSDIECGEMTLEADGWMITFCNEAGSLRTRESCYSPDGRAYAFTSSQPYSTNPDPIRHRIAKIDKPSPACF